MNSKSEINKKHNRKEQNKNISEAIIKRLPRYYRYLKELIDAGEFQVSSQKLSELLSITASQVRQDFCTCNFTGFGTTGKGYDVEKLLSQVVEILGLNKSYNVVIIGAGNIGRALAYYKGFADEGFAIKAVFDIDIENKDIPCDISLLHIDNLNNYTEKNKTDIAIIATQKDIAFENALKAKNAGINSIWNFAPIDISLDGVNVENINMSESLFVLTYRMNKDNLKLF